MIEQGDGRTASPASIAGLIEAQAARCGPRVAVTDISTDRVLTYGELRDEVARVASGLAALGVGKGDFVNVVLSNRIEHLLVSYACAWLGAIHVAINADFRDAALSRALGMAGAKLLVTEPAFADSLGPAVAGLGPCETIVWVGEPPAASPNGLPSHRFEDLAASAAVERTPVRECDPCCVLFTSGTTGPSKGCLLPQRSPLHSAEAIVECAQITDQDCVFTPYPLFHMRAAFLDVLPALVAGGRAIIAPRFSASRFWSDMRTHGVTIFSLIGTVQKILWSLDESPGDRAHDVRLTWGAPTPVDGGAFKHRYGIDVLPGDGIYGMSEIGMPTLSSLDPEQHGRVRDTHEIIIADDEDRPVEPGVTGEILVRPRRPAVLFLGYLNAHEATVDATRNLWFHTGDLGSVDAAGRLSFRGRREDRIRRAGHNVSAWEVEEVLSAHPAVAGTIVFGVESAMGEDSVIAAVALKHPVEERELSDFAAARLAPFMVPEDWLIVDELPMTSTGKPARGELVSLYQAPRDDLTP